MSVTTLQDLRTFIPINKAVKQAAMDMYADYEKVQAQYTAWAVRGIKKLTRESLKSPIRRAILPVNQNLNNAVLPCDFKEEIGVYVINSCNEKVPLITNPNIINSALIEELPCEPECPAKCACYPKQLCNDIQTTQVINKITINDVEYDQTVTSTLLPNGEYYIVTTTPVFNTVTSAVDYVDSKEYVTTFDLAECGCIKPTPQNNCRLEACCFDAWCCYCAPCSSSTSDVGGYKIFEENGTIHFDGSISATKIYLEYRGFLPKSGNEYLIPEVCFETIVEYTKHKSIANKKGVPQWERRDQFDAYVRERTNMTKSTIRLPLADIIHSALLVPKFSYNYNRCGGDGRFVADTSSSLNSSSNGSSNSSVTNTTVINTISCKPSILTTNGALMVGGTQYINSILSTALSFRIFANPFNRFLTTAEYNVLPQGGWEILTGVYGAGDEFDTIPVWC